MTPIQDATTYKKSTFRGALLFFAPLLFAPEALGLVVADVLAVIRVLYAIEALVGRG